MNSRANRADPGGAARASDVIVEQLRRMIVTLQLEPGAVVTEVYLMELLKCSRTPLREALQQLAQEHLVVAVPRRGVWIADMSVFDFGQLMETTSWLFRLVARLAAEHASSDELDRMAQILDEAERADAAGDMPRAAELDFEFHSVMAGASRNHYAVDALVPLQRLVTRFSFVGFRKSGSAQGAIEDHHRILEALQARDADLADHRATEHAEHGRDRIRAGL
ncbi:MAG: GntR family transcriptional regulator [Thermoleophilia bacterium]|nr:GntR family transcriptional regulator [Thermoleophilia bacterium]